MIHPDAIPYRDAMKRSRKGNLWMTHTDGATLTVFAKVRNGVTVYGWCMHAEEFGRVFSRTDFPTEDDAINGLVKSLQAYENM